MQVVWLKRDLRLTDNLPLQKALGCALQEGPVLPLYAHEPSLVAQPDCAAQHRAFIEETLIELRAELAHLGGSLCEEVGEIVEILTRLWSTQPFYRLWAYQESGTQLTFERDKAVHAWCRSHGVTFIELAKDGVRRGSLFKEQGFNFRAHLETAASTVLSYPGPREAWAPAPWPHPNVPQPRARGLDKPQRLKGGRQAADTALSNFLQKDVLLAYPGAISSPNTAQTGCSRLSPYLAQGVLSDREVIQALTRYATELEPACTEDEKKKLETAVRFYAERLYWRSAYLQNFERGIESETQNDLPAFNGLREEAFCATWQSAWEKGETGYPLIDAAMRFLHEHGWLNMRLRGTVTSFAVNELWLPWRSVGLFLAREFLDYEPGIHWNQLQIHAGTSRLSGPLTYKAVKQAEDQDPTGRFVRQWLPALRQVPLAYLYEPWTMPGTVQRAANCLIGRDYPAPIVPLAAAHEAARERVAALREGRPVPNLMYWKKRQEAVAMEKQGRLF